MQIIISFDEQLLARWDRRRDLLLFNIAWHFDGQYYPEKHWIDFGLVVIGWWFTVIDRLWQGVQEEEFLFMEGPYLIKAIQHQEEGIVELIPERFEVTWRVPLTELSNELIRVAKEVCQNLAQIEGGDTYRATIEKWITWLETNIQQARSKRAQGQSDSILNT
jgi:hypothetical protein